MEDYYELLKEYALNDENYKAWRKEHTKLFGEIFSLAFEENKEAQIHLTAALMHISQRRFEHALSKLKLLEDLCTTDYDRAALDYFMGLDHELMLNESEMKEYYERLRNSGISFIFPLLLHPYYRTAKFAQRNSECGKAILYYQNALSFYEGLTADEEIGASISYILYDIATVCLFMHDYSACERFLKASEEYHHKKNPHRAYVKAILYAVQGKKTDSRALLDKMDSFLRESCASMVNAILAGTELHYCTVQQDRSKYVDFWKAIIAQKSKIEKLLENGKQSDAQNIISNNLSRALSFTQRQLDCQIQITDDAITVLCKNYYIKTLIAEYEALFSIKPEALHDLKFVSVNEIDDV